MRRDIFLRPKLLFLMNPVPFNPIWDGVIKDPPIRALYSTLKDFLIINNTMLKNVTIERSIIKECDLLSNNLSYCSKKEKSG